ncbi:Uncharacterized protein Adt_25549 [Abeliophyllum distichum]|uniref:Uncharacterized protein n=1 Tax=Abeliophyllum distichum TaxID=126358 RepID=A0ABD1SGY2_9LAMI
MAEDKKREVKLKAVWFAAGMAAFMACLERFIFYTHWRTWVFLALNLLLLAIPFTSTMQTQIPSNHIDNCVGEYEDEKNKRIEECRPLVSNIGTDHCSNNLPKLREDLCVKFAAEYEDDENGKEGSFELSKEELNERVEAFIKMFRQQYLVSDATSTSCRLGSLSRTSNDISAKHLLVNSSNVCI